MPGLCEPVVNHRPKEANERTIGTASSFKKNQARVERIRLCRSCKPWHLIPGQDETNLLKVSILTVNALLQAVAQSYCLQV